MKQTFFERGEAMLSPTIKDIAVESLTPHPKNREIYGTAVSDDFVERVKRLGILEPLVVKADGTIISGHRRWLAARKCGFDTVPARLAEFEDELDEIEMLIICNDQRERTFSEMAAEMAELKRIESERARRRMGEECPHGKENLPYPEGQARDIIAAKYNISGKQVDKMLAIFERAQQGDAEASELMKALDAGDISVHKAYKTLKGQVDALETLKRGHKEHDEEVQDELETLRLENSRIAAALEEAKKVQPPVALPESKVERVEVEVIKEVVPPAIQAKLREQENLIYELQRREAGNPRLEEKRNAILKEIEHLREERSKTRVEASFDGVISLIMNQKALARNLVELSKNGDLTIQQMDEAQNLMNNVICAANDVLNELREIRGDFKKGGGLRAL